MIVRIRDLLWLIIAATGFLAVAPLRAEDAPVNLLMLEDTVFVPGLTLAGQESQIARLIDGDPSTVAILSASGGAPADIVLDFGDTTSPERLTLRLAHQDTGQPPVRFDLLVSMTSPTSGFRSLKAEPLDGLEPEVTAEFDPAAARWMMIRLYTASDAVALALADLEVWGHRGQPETSYDFGETPAEAIEIVAGLSALSVADFALTEQETALFQQARGQRLDRASYELAALLASGVRDPAHLLQYVEKLDRLEAAARSDLDLGAPPARLGARLLEWLHAGPLAGGYRERQTDLSVLLDQGIFNCVSSAVLYTALGLRLGLDVRGIEVPDHAFAIVYDGADHMDVETTTAAGFNPQRERIAEFEALTGFTYIPESNRDKRRELEEAGLAALIYYNHGVALLEEGRFQEAVLANFRAMSLDPDFASAATNALASLGRWSVALSEQGRWEDAVQVAAAAVRLAPDDAGLASRQTAIWQRWALEIAGTRRPEEAVDLLRRAATQVPDGGFAAMQAWIYVGPGEDLAKAGQWQAALEAIAPGRAVLEGEALAELEEWRRGLFLRWTNSLIAAREHRAAANVLMRARTDYPQDAALLRTIVYLAQEWAGSAPEYRSGLRALTEAQTLFPGAEGIDEVAVQFVFEAVQRAQASQSLADSLRMIDEAGSILSITDTATLKARSYELYGHALIDAKAWEPAAELYAEGLQQYPEVAILKQNARFVLQELQREAYDRGGPDGLAMANRRLALLFPQYGADVGDTELRRRVAGMVDAGAFEDARKTLQSGQLVLTPEGFEELWVLIVVTEARHAFDAGDPQRAARLYADGLAQVPQNRTLSQNAAYVAQEWMRTADETGGAVAVLTARSALAKLYPGNADIDRIAVATLGRSIAAKIDAQDFAGAKIVIVTARPHLPNSDVTALAEALYNGWGLSRVEAGDWPGAAAILAEGLRVIPDAADLERNATYVVQEWASSALPDGGAAGFAEVATAARTEFPHLRSIDRTLEAVLGRALQERLESGAPEDALALIGDVGDAIPPTVALRLKEAAYDQWARREADSGDWHEALRIYDLGLSDAPDSRLLLNNRKYAASQQP